MFNKVLKKVFGSRNDREIKRIEPIVGKVNELEPKMQSVPDGGFAAITDALKKRYKAGESLDDLMPEAFATVREVAWRKLKMRHFDVQLIGGAVLHEGKISEMKTGEGKTLVATLALCLNALSGKGAQLVTVNDYLARRDAAWMGPLYHELGLSLGIIQNNGSFLFDPVHTGDDGTGYYHLRPVSRREAYDADILYGTNNEYGFDYLRDNMTFSIEECVQREYNFAIVDEVDSILIDESRTPLIISGQAETSTDKYYTIDRIMPSLERETHFTVDEKGRQVILTEEGIIKVEELLNVPNLYDPKFIDILHHVNQALRAHVLFTIDVDYVVKDGNVIIVDEFTGRLMEGRRWGDGLHQAVEAKENVKIESENQTLATVTFQNFFRMYDKLAGMTGTADTEAAEFAEIYGLEVVVVPTNKPLLRTDYPDLVYRSNKEKFDAVIAEIKEWNAKGRPVLVGTISIDDSEKLSKMLVEEGFPHSVLNAKQHQGEAAIVAQAGRLGSVTLSTNMAGRGTDILLGGNPDFMAAEKAGLDDTTEAYKEAFVVAKEITDKEKEKVLELGGLHIIGTERHESRRIDNQLRGRAGRQGDPGSSRFYLSLEDDLMRIFGSDRIGSLMDKIGMGEGVPIEHGMVSRAIEGAQKKVESHNFDIRKHLLEYDDVMNQQREVVYGYRRQILLKAGLREMLGEFSDEISEGIVETHIEEKSHSENWDVAALGEAVHVQYGIKMTDEEFKAVGDNKKLAEMISNRAVEAYNERVNLVGDEVFAEFERMIMLNDIDSTWKDHLLSMDHLKGGIGLRGYGQKNPLQEYKREGYELFVDMIARFKADVVEKLFKVQITSEEAPAESIVQEQKELQTGAVLGRGESPKLPLEQEHDAGEELLTDAEEGGEAVKEEPIKREGEKVGRNDPCPCGSGKKYKKCCGIA